MKSVEEIARHIVATTCTGDGYEVLHMRIADALQVERERAELLEEKWMLARMERESLAIELAKLDEAVEALRPFADYAKYWSAPDKYIKDEQPVGDPNRHGFSVTSFPLTHGHCRQAAAIVAKHEKLPNVGELDKGKRIG